MHQVYKESQIKVGIPLNAPNSRAALTPKPPPPPHPRRCPPVHCQSNPPVTITHSFSQSQIPRRYYAMNMLTLLLENQSRPTDVTDTSIKTAGPEGNPFYNIYRLAKENEERRILQNNVSTAQSPTSRLWCLSIYHDALQAHMHPLHKLGHVNTV